MVKNNGQLALWIAKDCKIKVNAKIVIKKGESFLYPHFFSGLEYSFEEGIEELVDFIFKGILQSFFVELIYYFDGDEKGSHKRIRVRESNIRDEYGYLIEIAEDAEKITGSFSLEPNEEKLDAFIFDYLNNWQSDNLSRVVGNLYLPQKQLFDLNAHILDLLRIYPPRDLLLRPFDSNMDFLATLCFLESKGYLQIVSIESLDDGVNVRVNIQESFVEVFGNQGNYDDHAQYYAYLINADAFKKRIVFDATDKLWFDGAMHEFKGKRIPYHLLCLAREGRGEVDWDRLKEVTKESETVLKTGLKNFRGILRKKFGFSEDEAFFKELEGKLFFDMNLFYFLPKKARKATEKA